jgi:DNA-binding LacI/PurR family transcriptional regulator
MAGRLTAELGVGRDTVEAALRELEDEGLLINRGKRRRRGVVFPKNISPTALRVGILDYEPREKSEGYMSELYHLLSEAGHVTFFTPKCLTDLHMDVKRIARMVEQTPADAWVVGSGPREVLAWFAAQETPAFALFGRHNRFPIAAVGPDKALAFATAARRLIELGRRRISHLCHRQHRLPQPGRAGQAFLDELEAAGIIQPASINAGDFNLPDWEPTREGFTAQLDAMFRHTPPTALILDEPHLYSAALHFFAERGLRVPHDVSLICTDADRSFIWSEPSVAHIRWDHRPVIRRIVRWANNVARGKDDRRKTLTKAEFVAGGTVGRAPTLK